jgi:hypothetical protein
LKNLNISDKVMNSEDIARLFSRYGHEQNKIKYREFCEEIAKTNLDADNTYAGRLKSLL